MFLLQSLLPALLSILGEEAAERVISANLQQQ